jgi:hypothetical protein
MYVYVYVYLHIYIYLFACTHTEEMRSRQLEELRRDEKEQLKSRARCGAATKKSVAARRAAPGAASSIDAKQQEEAVKLAT